MKTIFIASLILFGSTSFGLASGNVRFYCYSFGNQPADAYLAEVGKCPANKAMATCLYAGGCMPAPEDGPKEPPEKTPDELGMMRNVGILKDSYLHCEASSIEPSGVKDASGNDVMKVMCPSPTKCNSLSYSRALAVGTEAPAASKPVPVSIPDNSGAVRD